MTTRPQALIILDGFGYRKDSDYNAIARAHIPFFHYLLQHYSHTVLEASGTSVGLLPKMMGNSAVGHFTIGVGNIIKQPITLLTEAIESGSFFENSLLRTTFKQAHEKNRTIHCIGLLSDAGVHSHERHLYALLTMGATEQAKMIVHPILDGRDVPPFSAHLYLERLEYVLKEIKNAHIGSLHGRFYAMDRDDNWKRTGESHKILLQNSSLMLDWKTIIEQHYATNKSEEFLKPISLLPHSGLKKDDIVIFFNIRADRARQLTALLLNYPHLENLRFIPGHQKINFSYEKTPSLSALITGIVYYEGFACPVLCKQPLIHDTLLQFLNEQQKTIFTIAESEKYAHITYFFNGGREVSYPQETRVVVPSIKKENYSDIPCMSAPVITQKLIESFNTKLHNFYLINYANADMVGHSGNFEATVKAIECLDKQLQQIYEVLVKKHNGVLYITGDHGNAEEKYDHIYQQIRTSHTTSPVYFLYVDPSLHHLPFKGNTLADIVPFIKENMVAMGLLDKKK